MKEKFAFLICFLATLVLGFADVRPLPASSCAASDSCCCSDPATVDPCVCGDFPDVDSPVMAAFVGLPTLDAPPSRDLRIEEAPPLAKLPLRWHLALPWRAPPEEGRSRLSVWIL